MTDVEKLIIVAREFGRIALKHRLEPDEFVSALHMAISISINAEREVRMLKNIELR